MQFVPQSAHSNLGNLKANSRSLQDWLLDTSIFYSFDQSGFFRHLKSAPPYPTIDTMNNKHVLVTGANSGIGYALCDLLLQRGFRVSMLCRSKEKGQQAQSRLEKKHNRKSKLYLADITRLKAIDEISAQITEEIQQNIIPPISTLVHNAGLLPNSLNFTSTGHELTVGTHLIGPSRLTAKLLSSFSQQARIIFMSSGGMYFAPLSPKKMLAYNSASAHTYDGVFAYALSKRAQVEFAKILHDRLSKNPKQIDVQSIHPGWVDTPGVKGSLASFHKRMQGRLRSSEQGALPTEWLCCLPPLNESSFWFDWAPRSPYLLGKRPTRAKLDALWKMVCEGADLPHNWV